MKPAYTVNQTKSGSCQWGHLYVADSQPDLRRPDHGEPLPQVKSSSNTMRVKGAGRNGLEQI